MNATLKKVIAAIVVLALVSLVLFAWISGWFADIGEGISCQGMREYEKVPYGTSDCWERKNGPSMPAICLISSGSGSVITDRIHLKLEWENLQDSWGTMYAVHMNSMKEVNVYIRHFIGSSFELISTYKRPKDADGEYINPLVTDYVDALLDAMDGRQDEMQISDQDYLDLQCVMKTKVI